MDINYTHGGDHFATYTNNIIPLVICQLHLNKNIKN